MPRNNNLLSINKRSLRIDFSWLPDLEKIIKRKFKISQSISIALVKKAEIKKFNNLYRGQNKITDVLSFNIDSQQILGEIVICLDKAKEQAQENKKSLKSELQLLTVHGILHLLGYDHEQSLAEEKKQKKTEQEILSLLNKKLTPHLLRG